MWAFGRRITSSGQRGLGANDLRSVCIRAVTLAMRFGGQYVLGIDALPRGNYAAVAIGRSITDTFLIKKEGAIALPLEERVRQAVIEAEVRTGARPAEVRLVCIDDGADGSELGLINQWLEDEVESRLQILDMVGRITAPDVGDPVRDQYALVDPAVDPTAALSVARACEAALW